MGWNGLGVKGCVAAAAAPWLRSMTPDRALAEARSGSLRPVYLIVGEESFIASKVLDALVAAADTGVTAGFNIDKWQATDVDGSTAVAAARTMPMMARLRVVVVDGLERWDGKGREEGKGRGAESLDALAAYAAAPVDSSLLLLRARKLNGSRKLVKLAKAKDFIVSCEPLPRRELPGWIREAARGMGHAVDRPVADLLAELVGPELGGVYDALERLSLYVGPGQPIGEDAVEATITRVRLQTVWTLVDALSSRDVGTMLGALGDATQTRDAALPLLGAVGYRVKQLLRYQSARRDGQSQADAAKAAGVPPFKARDLESAARKLDRATLESWLLLLAEADLAAKGSRRPSREVVATALIEMCRTGL